MQFITNMPDGVGTVEADTIRNAAVIAAEKQMRSQRGPFCFSVEPAGIPTDARDFQADWINDGLEVYDSVLK